MAEKKFQINPEPSTRLDAGGRFRIQSGSEPSRDTLAFRIEEPHCSGEASEPLRAFCEGLLTKWHAYVNDAVEGLAAVQATRDSALRSANNAAAEGRRQAQERLAGLQRQLVQDRAQLAILTERATRVHGSVFARQEPNAVWRTVPATSLEQVVQIVENAESAATRLGSGPTWRIHVQWWRQAPFLAGLATAASAGAMYFAIGSRWASVVAAAAAIAGILWWASSAIRRLRSRRIAERILVRQSQEALSAIRAFGSALDQLERESASAHQAKLATIDRELNETSERAQSDCRDRQAQITRTFRASLAGLAASAQTIPAVHRFCAAPWNDPAWQGGASSTNDADSIRIGEVAVSSPDPLNPPPVTMALPAVVSFLPENGLYIRGPEGDENRAAGVVQAFLVRLLASSRPGSIRILAIDPKGLGGSLGRLVKLMGGPVQFSRGVVSSDRDVEQALRDLLQHMADVVQKRLMGVSSSLSDHNRASKIKEPYVVVPVFDYPTGLSLSTLQLLATVCTQGPKAGVFPIVVDSSAAGQRSKGVEQGLTNVNGGGDLWTLQGHGKAVPFRPDSAPSIALVESVCERYSAGIDEGNNHIPFSEIQTNGSAASSAANLRIPIGLAVDGSVKELVFGEGTAHSALIGGRPGSGKSNLLNVIVLSATSKYSPRELELYLIDFKKGVEFKAFATSRLPHARVIAVESEREFGLSVLRSLDAELSRRGEAFREAGASDLPGFRALGRSCPRVLLVIDEFQEFFASDDGHAADARELLSRLILQGRGFGIHVLLASQSIGGPRTLPRAVLDQVVVRIALQASEDVSRQILSDDNPAAAHLRPGGYALYNASGGVRSANEPMRVAFLSTDEKVRRLGDLPRSAEDRAPTVFEGRQPAELATSGFFLAENLRKHHRSALLGEPSILGAFVTADIGRPSRHHMVMVAKQPSIALGMMTASLLSVMATTPLGAARFWLCDASDGQWTETISVAAEHSFHETLLIPADKLLGILEAFGGGGNDEATHLFLVAPSATGKHAPLLRGIAGGIERATRLGLRLVMAFDSVSSVSTALTRSVLEQVAFRSAGVMSLDHSSSFLKSTAASRVDGRYQAVFLDVDEGDQLTVFRPYAHPDPEALREHFRRLATAAV